MASTRIAEIRGLFRASRRMRWVPVPSEGVNIIYQRASPLWARWVHVLVALDVMMITSIIEYTWNISGVSTPKVEQQIPSKTKGSETEKLPEHLAERMQMQPFWKKFLFSGMFVTSGVLCGGAILASRARLLRRLTFARGGPGGGLSPTLYFQTASHPKGFGVAIPVKDCSIASGDIPSRLLVRVLGMGAWLVDLRGATIGGQAAQKGNIEVTRAAMLRAWHSIGGRIAPPKAKK